MVCLWLEPGASEWKAQTNPLSYGGTPEAISFYNRKRNVLNEVELHGTRNRMLKKLRKVFLEKKSEKVCFFFVLKQKKILSPNSD